MLDGKTRAFTKRVNWPDNISKIRVRYEYISYAFVGCENMKLFDADALLFDLDGLLVDTEQLHWKAYR
jgi:hypothetical protein